MNIVNEKINRIYEIGNGCISVGINSLGAELEYLKINGINVLWQKNSEWTSQSPILFPNVGALIDGSYFFDRKRYELKRHGFARSSIFEVELIDKNLISLSLIYSKQTLQQYPFKFKLYVIYEIKDNKLSISFKVINLDDKDIPFSLGIHPGFSYLGLSELLGENYSFEVHTNNSKEVLFDGSFIKKIIDNKTKYNSLSQVTDELISKGTICLSNSRIINFASKSHRLVINNEMSYVALWQANPDDNPKFICVEGWEGLPDEQNKTSRDIFKKLGNIILEKNSTYNTNFEIYYE